MKKETADPVACAERALSAAQAGLKANLEEQAERTKAVAQLEEVLGTEPDGKDILRQGAMLAVHTARVKRLVKDEQTAQAAVKAAEAALVAARADKAQADIAAQDGVLDDLNAQIIASVEAVLKLIAEHEEVVTGRDRLAHAHNLGLPGRRRFLFPHGLIRSKETELRRERLDLRYALGGVSGKPAEAMPPVGVVPSG